MFRVLGMGNALTDVLIRLESDDVLHSLNLPKGSMQLIDENQLKEILSKTAGYPSTLVCGGSAANTITGISKLGVPAGFIYKVHKDDIGENYSGDLESYGISTMTLFDEKPSGRSLVFITPDGERTMATYLGAAASMTADEIKDEMFEGFDFFYTEGYLVQNHDLIETSLKKAKQAGLKVALDLASYNVVEAERDFLKHLIEDYVDIVFANEEEAQTFSMTDPLNALNEISGISEIAVVKLGSKGAMAKNGGIHTVVNAVKAECVDTTGAGDLFAAGFIYGLSSGQSIDISLKYGTITAAKVIEQIGPRIDEAGWGMIKEAFIAALV
jgi:sugar/nucleoside kinase (ribokinase family)